METEVWPNLFSACRRAGVPVALVNARLSERSARGYRRIGGLAREALQNLSLVAAQTRDDAARLTALGARRVEITAGAYSITRRGPAPASPAARGAHQRVGVAGCPQPCLRYHWQLHDHRLAG